MAAKHKFDLHLPGLLKVLAEHLYSSKKVGVRELIQNAHDSCTRRRIEAAEPDYQPRVDVRVDPAKRLLTISDNGNGLTEEEITTYLATIGRGYTRELRERLALCSPEEAGALIGQFGLGFLSAFLLAQEVTLTTRSLKGGPCLRWHSAGDEHYDLTQSWRDDVGTTVELRVKPAASFVLEENTLASVLRTYADFLPIPIHLQGESYPINLMSAPWEADDPITAARHYLNRMGQKPGSFEEPLWILPLTDGQVDLGHDRVRVPLKGFLYVPPGSVMSLREYGDVSVYIRRMFICERERDLLPPWARFVRGVIECPSLQPTASREGIHQDENYESIRQVLEDQLGRGLRELADSDEATWRKIVRGHANVIIGWAVSDNEFFDRVQDVVTFRTSRGQLSLREYLQLTQDTIYYVTQELGSLQEQVLAEGRDVPVIDASWFFAVQPFLQKYVSRHPEVGLIQLDGEAEQMLRPVPEGPFAAILESYQDQGVRAEVASFRPTEVPAVVLYPKGAELAQEAEASAEAGDLPAPLAGLVNEYIDEKFAGGETLRGTLYLNASCPLVRHLAEKPPAEPMRTALLTLLHQVARLFAGRMMTPVDAVEAFRKTTGALEELMRS